MSLTPLKKVSFWPVTKCKEQRKKKKITQTDVLFPFFSIKPLLFLLPVKKASSREQLGGVLMLHPPAGSSVPLIWPGVSSAADTVTACSMNAVLQKDICQTLWQQERHRSIPSK